MFTDNDPLTTTRGDKIILAAAGIAFLVLAVLYATI